MQEPHQQQLWSLGVLTVEAAKQMTESTDRVLPRLDARNQIIKEDWV